MPPQKPDQRLRDDVRLLGELLGDVLREHEGTALFDLVEQVRALAKQARRGDAARGEELRALAASIPAAKALPLARAFAHFLGLANVAEQHDRARALATSPLALVAAVRAARAAGVEPSAIAQALRSQHIELVLTAHPTQVVRRTVRMQYRATDDALTERDHAAALGATAARGELARRVALLWHTDEVRKRKPTAFDEVRGALVVFEQVLWDAVPRYMRHVDHALESELSQTLEGAACPVTFGSWVGGDRDGNPLVTSSVTRYATLRARWTAARLWQDTLTSLRDELAVVVATEDLRARAAGAREPYRAVLSELVDRFALTERWCESASAAAASGAEPSPPPPGVLLDVAELVEVLDMCDASLRALGLKVVADGLLLDARRRARCFGVVLAPLDVRQEASVHVAVMDAITRAIGLGSYAAWSEPERVAFLRRELVSQRFLLPRDPLEDPTADELFATLRVVATAGPGAFGAYVISMARAASDVLLVALLQREARVSPPLRVVPLFETLGDLAGARDVMDALLREEAFTDIVGERVEVMVGYSDSTKDAGRLGSAWAIHGAIEGIADVVRAHGREPIFFHGRGGTVGRGGGPIRDSMLSLPPGSLRGRLRVTVQGEAIDSTLGLEAVAIQSLDRYVSSVLEVLHVPAAPVDPAWRDEMTRLSAEATASYRAVVHQDPGFVPYFRAVTPERELSLIHAGSRPERRRAGDDVASLRAIPWVFAWNQARLILPAWLGLGDVFDAALEDEARRLRLQAMAKHWPFFRSLVSLVSMAIAKADPTIVELYEDRLVDPSLRSIGAALRERFVKTKRSLLRVLGADELLEDDAALQASIALRNPYIDPLNVLQAELLRRMRASDERDVDDRVVEAFLVTVNGIAAGLRNTG